MHTPLAAPRRRDDGGVTRLDPNRRLIVVGTLLAALAGRAIGGTAIDVWLDLSEPPPGLQASAPVAADRIRLVRAQQDDIAARLPAIGAVELARIQQVGNTMAVRIDADRLPELQALPGVKRVRPVRTLHPPRPMP